MTNKEHKTTFKNKTPKTVEIKLLVPYAIIVSLLLVIASLYTGWTIRSDFDNNVRNQVTAQVQALKADQ